MTKQQFSLREFVITALAASVVILSLAIFSTNTGIHDQAHLDDTFSARSQLNNEKALQLDGLNNEINQFMIYEFKNIYHVKA